MSVLRIILVLVSLAFGGCSSLTGSRSSFVGGSAHDVVEKLFVERLSDPATFQYFHFWGLDAVRLSFDEKLLSEYINFKKIYTQRVDCLTKRGWVEKFGLGSFPIFARVDPLTMCSKKPLKIEVSKVSKDEASAVYTVKYVQFGNYAKYSSVRTVSLVKKSGRWVLAWVSTETRDGESETTSTFVSQLKFLTQKLYSETTE